jgi:hypothetical protein
VVNAVPSIAPKPKPKAPIGLGAAGRKLWRDMHDGVTFEPSELARLEQACFELDLIRRMHAEIEGADLIAFGSMRQPVAHPMAAELRQHRAIFASLLVGLKVPAEVEATKRPGLTKAQAGRLGGSAQRRPGGR